MIRFTVIAAALALGVRSVGAELDTAGSKQVKAGAASSHPVLARYYFTKGFHAGSLRARVALPVYVADPDHLWNRLFAALYVREVRPRSRDGYATRAPVLAAGEKLPARLTKSQLRQWKQTYHRNPRTRLEGGDVVDPPLAGHPRYLLESANFVAVDKLLGEFVRTRGERKIRDPLRRALLQRDLWPVFDLLQQTGYWDRENWKPYTAAQNRRRKRLSRQVAIAMMSLAPSESELPAISRKYALAMNAGRFSKSGTGDAAGLLLPLVLGKQGDWIEVSNSKGGLLEHTKDSGLHGRSRFRVFLRFPNSAGGRAGVRKFFQQGRWNDRRSDVPPGTGVALVRTAMIVTRDGKVVSTPIVEKIELRLLRHVDGRRHEQTDSGYGQNIVVYELRRSALLSDRKEGGLVRVGNGEPRYRFGVSPFSTFAHSGPQRLMPLKQTCIECHNLRLNRDTLIDQNSLRRVHSGRKSRKPPLGYPFGKASLSRSFEARLKPSIIDAAEIRKLAGNVSAYKMRTAGFQSLLRLGRRP